MTCLAFGEMHTPVPPGCHRRPISKGENEISKYDKEDDKSRYEGNGHDPNRPVPQKDSGGKHGEPDTDDKDDKNTGR